MSDFGHTTLFQQPEDSIRLDSVTSIPQTLMIAESQGFSYAAGQLFKDGQKTELSEESIREVEFLNGKVFSFNASIGWNGSRSECSISLVEDLDNDDPKKFLPPVVGSPQFFEVFNTDGKVIWNFYGIVRSVMRDVDPSRRSFTVLLESPNVILDSVSLIMSDFAGAGYALDRQDRFTTSFNSKAYDWNKVYNIINLFGFWENDQFGTRQAGFGQAESNEVGMPWKKVVIALNEIVNRTHTNNVFINDGNNVLGGSLAFSSTEYNNGKPYLYCLDIDSLVSTMVDAGVNDGYRLESNQSISGLINDMCEIINAQWFCTLEKNEDNILNTYTNDECAGVIKIHVVRFQSLPKLNTISDFSSKKEGLGTDIVPPSLTSFPDSSLAYDIDDNNNTLEQSSTGIELSDISTGKIVIGSKRSTMVEYSQRDIYMYWGSLKPANAALDDLPIITPLLGPLSRDEVIPIDIRDIVGEITVGKAELGKRYWNGQKTRLPPTVYKGIYYASVLELRFAAIDYDNWESYISHFCQKKRSDLNITGESRPFLDQDGRETLHQVISALSMGTVADANNMSRMAFLDAANSYEDSVGIKNLKALYDKIVDAFNMYGKEFMVPMPVCAYKWTPETSDFVSEWDIATSAYTDINNGPNSPNFDPKFLDDNGRTEAYAIFPSRDTVIDARNQQITGALNFVDIDGSVCTIAGNSVYIKTSVDEKIYYIKQSIPPSPSLGQYIYANGNTSFFYPELLTAENPFLGSLPFGRPTTEFFGYYTDLRGALPFAKISLPSSVYYMKDALGLSMNYDGLNLIMREVEKDIVSAKNYMGSDRQQAPVAEGVVFPKVLSLPLQSNRHYYGPWMPRFNQSVAGKVEVEFDDNLAPENFSIGGYGFGFDAMDSVGYAKAMPDNIGFFANETGSFSIVGVSKVGLGKQLIEGGPYVTDISVSIDNATIKSNISTKTWNLDFGKMKKYYVDRILRLSKTQIKVNKSKREAVTRFEKMVKSNSVPSRFRGESSSTIIAATIQPTLYFDPWQENLFEVSQVSASIMPFHNMMSHIKENYSTTAASTLDAFYAPVTMSTNGGNLLPILTRPKNFSIANGDQINPYISSGWVGQNSYGSGIHNIHAITRGNVLPPDLSIKHSMASDLFNEDSYSASGEPAYNIRVVANRVPQMATGWGIDVNGGLTPSGVDRKTKTSEWHAGPELKVWDRHKGMWMGSFPVMCGVLEGNLNGGSLGSPSSGNVIRLLKTPNGVKTVEKAPIFCFDGGFGTAPSGTMVYYTNWDGFNIPIYAACSGTTETILLGRNFNG